MQAVKTDQSIEDRCRVFLESFKTEVNSKISVIEHKVAKLETNQSDMSTKLSNIDTQQGVIATTQAVDEASIITDVHPASIQSLIKSISFKSG